MNQHQDLDEKSLNEALKDFRDLADSGCALLLITHDIDAALKIADRVAIFYGGTTLEIANVEDFKNNGMNLRHPYTKALFNALPNNDFEPIDGSQASCQVNCQRDVYFMIDVKKEQLIVKT